MYSMKQEKQKISVSQKPPVRKKHWLGYFLIVLGVVASGLTIVSGYLMALHDVVEPNQIILSDRQLSQEALKNEIIDLVHGYPLEAMAPYIAKQDRPVAAYLVSIAKKESNWGKRVPVDKNGKDCFNYWGYRDPDDTNGSGGHTCFAKPGEAVASVAKRIHQLVYEEQRDTPAKMIVWKCGYSCSGHSPASVSKWKQDVAFYFKKFVPQN